ncbi:hypothetical protein VB715_08260 [Crocosphaera sp. UHCC 0190]|uniref:hypothetical protein n=1 Tax=Crocosphaera sp. UHCC 0190 TaxID=3110246 RepID=UPI002B1EA157|nr:hypothetical protein [Crocosphaera sp. UHCC 0190]MEA5509755.1 hypothetical protein [Crocosphaera sp. UHCC 0190]
MSSSDHSPYKSRLFNFLNRQSLRWRDRLFQSAQHLRIAVEWGTQILIYPIYLMVQAGRSTKKRLGNTFKQAVLPHQTIEAPQQVDRPLKRLLEEAERCLEETEILNEQNQENAPYLSNLTRKIRQKIQESLSDPDAILNSLENNSIDLPILIQGMASEINNHHLVLVTEDNSTLDILSESQQIYLQRQISLEIANYWYDLKQSQTQEKLGLIPTFSQRQEQVLPPIRWFWQIMRWVQTSPVAIAIDLFGESSLVPSSQVTSSTSSETFPLLTQLDDQLANWEKTIPETSSDKLGQLKNIIQQAIAYFFAKTSQQKLSSSPDSNPSLIEGSESIQVLEKPWQILEKWGVNPEKKANSSLNADNSDPFSLQVLIYAAIDYFFGKTSRNSQLKQKQSDKILTSAKASQEGFNSEKIDDPWLSWDDLYGENSSILEDIPNPISPAFLPQSEKLPKNPIKSLKKKIERQLAPPKSSKSLTKSQSNLKGITAPKKVNKSLVKPFSNPSSIIQPSPKNKIEQVSSDWVETEAKSTGYIKHPLVRVLEWFDLIIHRLEEWGAKLWRWLGKLRS